MSRVKDLRVQVRLFNNQLKERREATGKSACGFADAIGVSRSDYCRLESLKGSPLTSGRGGFGRPRPVTWKPIALRVAESLGVTAEILFPAAVLAIEKRDAELRADAEDLACLANPEHPTPFGIICDGDERHALYESLQTLTPRERRVLEMRFGLDGTGDGDGETFDAVCQHLGVTKERARQIGDKALRKLRHPTSQIAQYARMRDDD